MTAGSSAADRPTIGFPSVVRRESPGPCQSCGGPHARFWSTGDGPARLCPPCATLHGIGCP